MMYKAIRNFLYKPLVVMNICLIKTPHTPHTTPSLYHNSKLSQSAEGRSLILHQGGGWSGLQVYRSAYLHLMTSKNSWWLGWNIH